MRNFWKGIFYLTSFSLLLPAFAKVIYVDDNATEDGNGSSWATAHKYLQDALAVAEFGDEIWVAEGVYKPDQGAGKIAGNRSESFILLDNINMYGGFLGSEISGNPLGDNNKTILSGQIDENPSLWSLNVVKVGPHVNDIFADVKLDANVTISGFKITNGNGADLGAGLSACNINGELNIFNTIFTNNSAKGGGGATNFSSFGKYSWKSMSVNLDDCIFTNNSAGYDGGAVDNYGLRNLDINDCIFTNNSAGENGGAISNSLLEINLNKCVFTNNSAPNGGVFYNRKVSLFNIKESEIVGNIGSGIFIPSSGDRNFNYEILNCAFSHNKGSGIEFNHMFKDLTILNSKFVGNSKSGIIIRSDSDGVLDLNQCIFKTNSHYGIFLDEPGFSSNRISNCVFEENSEGGINYHDGPTNRMDMILINTIFYKNLNGGLILKDNCEVRLNNCVFTKCERAIYNLSGFNYLDPSITINNCILWENYIINAIFHGIYDLDQHNVIIENSNILQNPNVWTDLSDRVIDEDPLFVNADDPIGPDGIWFTADDGLRLRPGSPAIDSGFDSDPSIQFDIAGLDRRQGSSIDIGAYEYIGEENPRIDSNASTQNGTTDNSENNSSTSGNSKEVNQEDSGNQESSSTSDSVSTGSGEGNQTGTTTNKGNGNKTHTTYEEGVLSNRYLSVDMGKYDNSIIFDADWLTYEALGSQEFNLTTLSEGTGKGTHKTSVHITSTIYKWIPDFLAHDPASWGSDHKITLMNEIMKGQLLWMGEIIEGNFETVESAKVKSAWAKEAFDDGSFHHDFRFLIASPKFEGNNGEDAWISVNINFSVETDANMQPPEYSHFEGIVKNLRFHISNQNTNDSDDKVIDTSNNNGNEEQEENSQVGTNNSLVNSVKPASDGSSWYELDWFGYFFDSSNVVASMGGWVFHEDLGWLFLEFSSNEKVWCWASNKGWLWTSSSAYPYLYSDQSSNWVYVLSEAQTQVSVFDFKPNKWSAWQDLTLMRMVDPVPGSSQNNSETVKQIDGVLKSSISNKKKISSIAEIIRSNLQ